MGFTPRKAMISILAMALSFSTINMILVSQIDNTVLFITDISNLDPVEPVVRQDQRQEAKTEEKNLSHQNLIQMVEKNGKGYVE